MKIKKKKKGKENLVEKREKKTLWKRGKRKPYGCESYNCHIPVNSDSVARMHPQNPSKYRSTSN